MTQGEGAFAGVVPASGESRRMGRTKALLVIDGKTFVRRVVEALRGAGCDPVFVVVTDPDGPVAVEAASAGGAVLHNLDPGDGPITSLRLALEVVHDDAPGVAYLPLDHPLVEAETIAALLEASNRSRAQLTVPMFGDKRGHPAVFRRPVFPELLDLTLEGGARMVVHRHLASARLMDVTDEGVITDIDTPEAYEAVLRRRSGVAT